jgi:broad specificity phosphatase PhoE
MIAMTNILFIRHTAHDFLGNKIPGRLSGVHLNALGVKQAEQVGERLSILPIDAIYCSPLERACETAAPLAKRLHIKPQISEAFNEVDMGEWTNKMFSELDALTEWRNWNAFRSSTLPPRGESMLDVQARVVRQVYELRPCYRCVAIFSHGDVIRAALAHFLGLHVDLLSRIEIDPGAVSLVQVYQTTAVVRVVNANALDTELLPQLSDH